MSQYLRPPSLYCQAPHVWAPREGYEGMHCSVCGEWGVRSIPKTERDGRRQEGESHG